MFCKQYRLKLIAASLGLAASVNAYAALGGLQVQSRLNEPFSATVVATGDEARALARSAKPTINGANLRATVTHQGADRAVIRLRSSAPVKEPVVTFWLGVGDQNHQYTAMLDPRGYRQAGQSEESDSRRGRRGAESAHSRRYQSARRHGRPVHIEGRDYQIKDGELLVDIAERIKPSGMTLRQTINALVAANPRAFRNGNPDLMYRGATLVIPDADTLRRLAHNPPRRTERTRPSERSQTEGNGNMKQTPPPAQDTAAQPTEPTPSATLPEQAQSPQTTPPQTTPPQATPPQATPQQPEMPAETPPADGGVAASSIQPAETQASMPTEMPVSEPLPVEEPTPEEGMASIEVAPPLEDMPPEEEGSELDLKQLAIYGGAGLLALGGFGYLLWRRKKSSSSPSGGGRGRKGRRAPVEEDDEDEDDLYFESVAEQPSAVKAQPVKVEQAAVPPVSEQDLGLDLSHLDAQQQLGSTPDTATVSRQAAEADDWNWLEQTAGQTSGSAQPAARPAADTEDDWLNFGNEEAAQPKPETRFEPEAAPLPQAEPVAEEDLDWVLDEASPARQPLQAESAATQEDNSLDFQMPGLDEGKPLGGKEPAAPAATDNGLDFNFDFDDDKPAAPASVGSQPPEPRPAASAAQASAGPLPKEALEAKLELAKMYLEIDDANTARQTLLELINESAGSSIQAQAQALLNDIGK